MSAFCPQLGSHLPNLLPLPVTGGPLKCLGLRAHFTRERSSSCCSSLTTSTRSTPRRSLLSVSDYDRAIDSGQTTPPLSMEQWLAGGQLRAVAICPNLIIGCTVLAILIWPFLYLFKCRYEYSDTPARLLQRPHLPIHID